MCWQSKMNILSYFRGQVNRLPPVELLLEGKRLDDQLGFEFVEAGHASQADTETDPPGRKDPVPGNTHGERIAKRGNRSHTDLFQLQKPGILGTLDMDGASLRYLAQMNLHTGTLIVKAGTFNGQI